MGYFKDISKMLAKKYPDRRVFVISDQHFDHKNIISLTRSELFNSSDINDSVSKMNEYIISKHNSVVSEDDIVIMLGDFSFKVGRDRLSELVSKLNGHKFLVMGNHDKIARPDLYLDAGFEEVFLFPVKFNGDFFSHYPLNATVESNDRPNTLLYNLLCKEFSGSYSGINFHGHQHTYINNGKSEKNVACEVIDYKPLLIGRTKSYQDVGNISYINEEFFEIMHTVINKFTHLQEKNVMTDYLYTILLEILSEYEDDILVFGSLMLNKKYSTNFIPSDLDATKLYDSSKSISVNRKSIKELGDDIYKKIVQVDGFNPDFYKKIDFICILSFIYANKNSNFKGYLDMNMLYDDFYKSDDFIKLTGGSLLEKYAKKEGINTSNKIRYPRFNIQTTNALADFINCFLQYAYSTDIEKKKCSLIKMKQIIDNVNYSGKCEDFDKLQNMLIRYLLRNIYFFESAKRKNETNIILETREIEIPNMVGLDSSLKDSLGMIISSNDYRNILNSISNADNRKQEVSAILKYYK